MQVRVIQAVLPFIRTLLSDFFHFFLFKQERLVIQWKRKRKLPCYFVRKIRSQRSYLPKLVPPTLCSFMKGLLPRSIAKNPRKEVLFPRYVSKEEGFFTALFALFCVETHSVKRRSAL